MSNMPKGIPDNVVNEIVAFIKNQKELFQIGSTESIIGKRIFDILEKTCLVVYYPIMDAEEKNDAFLLTGIPLASGKKIDIIYINSFQTEEKQVFAATHELGHYLKISEKINKECHTEIDEERIVNRFAAELLMPHKLFVARFMGKTKEKEDETRSVNMHDMLQVIVEMMNEFSVPYNAVVIRMVEAGIISKKDGIMLVDGSESVSLESIRKEVDRIISEGNYENLRKSSRKKYIKDLDVLLESADEKEAKLKTKIDRIRDRFGIVKNSDTVFDEMIRITEEK